MKYRKKPVVIEAVQLRWDTWDEMCKHAGVGEAPSPHGCYIDAAGNATDNATRELGMRIPTLEGVMIAREGDYIIRGVKGELYPCKPDIFDATYEPADGPDQYFQAGFRVGLREAKP